MQILLKGIEFDFPLCKELNCQKVNFQFFSVIRKIENWIENCQNNNFQFFSVIQKIENWIENCQNNNFQFLSLSEKSKIELKIAQNQFSFFWNYWKLNKNERDVFVHGCFYYSNLKLNFNFLELFYKSSKFSLDKIPKYLFDKLLFFIL